MLDISWPVIEKEKDIPVEELRKKYAVGTEPEAPAEDELSEEEIDPNDDSDEYQEDDFEDDVPSDEDDDYGGSSEGK